MITIVGTVLSAVRIPHAIVQNKVATNELGRNLIETSANDKCKQNVAGALK